MKNNKSSIVGKIFPYRVNTFFGRFDYWRLKRRVKKLWKFYHKQYHIVPLDNGNVTVMDNNFRKHYNTKVEKHKRISYLKLIQMAYFSTPSGNRLIIL